MNLENETTVNGIPQETADVDDFSADDPYFNPEVPEEMAQGMLYYAKKFAFVAGHVLSEKFPLSKLDFGIDNYESAIGIAGRVRSFLVYSMLQKLQLLAENGYEWAARVSELLEQHYTKLWKDKTDEEMKEYDQMMASGQLFLSSVEKQKLYDPFSFLQGSSYTDEDMQNNPVTRLCIKVAGKFYGEEDHPRVSAFLMEMAGSMLSDYFDCFWGE
jgi:hypothetical protein